MRPHRTAALLAACLFTGGLGQPGFINSPCANSCSGHGLCDVYHVCNCADTWTGADCSRRTCPVGRAWADEVSAIAASGVGHAAAECSRKGLCDRDATQARCVCQAGFEGAACERSSCGDACYGRGACVTLEYYASRGDPGAGEVYDYSGAWDAKMLRSCSCAAGFAAHDCSVWDCPTGDDPFTLEGNNEVQRVTCEGDRGTVVLAFRGASTKPIPWDATASDVRAALLQLPTLRTSGGAISVGVVGSVDVFCGHPAVVTEISFLQDFGDLPALVPDVRDLGYTLYPTKVGKISVAEMTKGTKEDRECSGRGLCDTLTGRCGCDQDKWGSSDGYGGRGTRGDCGVAVDLPIEDCPGEIPCNGHGVCDDVVPGPGVEPTYACACQEGWTGADRRPAAVTTFERFGVGTQREIVTVMLGEYLACPSDVLRPCNGHGECKTMAQLFEAAGRAPYRSDVNDPYTWDDDMVRGCHCDDGWAGYDCSLRTCLAGDDPLTAYVVDVKECSGRGLCDYEKGTCDCFDQFGASDGSGGKGPREDCGFVLPILPGVA
ncbi:hypothetical protein JL720_1432 [Aureococcus anophagefferens]|nr:hypothetical protein JL720_1432 [Aureococcus anophagefferens]